MKKFLFLDFDNTMMETEPFAVPSLIARFNELYGTQIPAPLTAAEFQEHFHGQAREGLCENLSAHFGIHIDYATLYKDREWFMMQHLQNAAGGVPMAKGLLEALTELHGRGVTLSFVSNNPVQRALAAMRYADNGQGDALAALFGTRFFEAGDVQKPKPDVYLRAMAQVGAPPAGCVAVEDSVTGATAAAAAGLTVFGYTGFAPDAQAAGKKLTGAGCIGVFSDWAYFPRVFSEL
ncbi:MAG: HAD-IA family hydrolase [Alphaproteobacteria bacterium]|nr:HAD-IA family hydrolase [Alphaproteobacteria bacterium]